MKKTARAVFHTSLLTLLLILQGCASPPNTRAYFQTATLNDQPAHLLMDTGASTTTLTSSAARRIGFRFTPPPHISAAEKARHPGETPIGLSDPASLALGSQPITAQFPVVSAGLPEDGLVGWPEIRDNILIFDPIQRTITATDQLPPQTATWLPLHILRDNVLLLEVPLSSGKTGTVLIDTGAPNGVSLPPAQWKTWHAAHPKALSKTSHYHGPSVGNGTRLEAWADEITLGNLTLTDVPVLPATPFESTWIPDYAGSLGMYALERMELITDGKNNIAYLHPLPPPGPYYQGFHRAGINPPTNDPAPKNDWTIAENLRINGAQLLLFSASFKWHTNDHPGALADLDRAITLDPKNLDAYLARAGDRLTDDDFDGAIADYTRALELNPKIGDAYIQRAIARQCRGDFTNAIADYDEGIARNPKDMAIPARIARELLHCRLGHPTPDFAQTVAGWPQAWPKPLGLFVAGQLDEAALLAVAKKAPSEEKPGKICGALYCIGTMRLIKGDTPGARNAWQQSLATGAKNYFDYKFAQSDLARLGTSH